MISRKIRVDGKLLKSHTMEFSQSKFPIRLPRSVLHSFSIQNHAWNLWLIYVHEYFSWNWSKYIISKVENIIRGIQIDVWRLWQQKAWLRILVFVHQTVRRSRSVSKHSKIIGLTAKKYQNTWILAFLPRAILVPFFT